MNLKQSHSRAWKYTVLQALNCFTVWFLKINSSFYSEGRYAHSIAKALQPHPSRFGISASFVLDTTWARAPANDEPNFFVLYVDNRFAIVYFCEEFGRMKLDLAWIMSRDRKAKKAELDDMETILHAHGLYPKMVDVDQDNCPPQDKSSDGKLWLLLRQMMTKED